MQDPTELNYASPPTQSFTLSSDPLQAIRNLVSHDYLAFETALHASYRSHIPLINEVSEHIITSGGKHIRPLCLLLAARSLNFEHPSHAIDAATAVEYIHTATLLHDDVVDESDLRRNRPTARKLWGNMASILVGDYLYSQAFALLVKLDRPEIMPIFVRTTTLLAEGEAFQLMNRHNTNLNEKDYRYIITNKTGVLFETATLFAATLADASNEQKHALASFGMHLGLAFQMIDDALDYQGNTETIGKNIGDDLAEGCPTLPIIYALATGNMVQKTMLEKAIRQGALEELENIIDAVEATGAIAYTVRCAQQEAELALEILKTLPASEYREGLAELAKFAVERRW